MKLNEVFGRERLDSRDVAELMDIRSGMKDDISEDLFAKLFDVYANNGEMPYGVAKARTGDPYEWIVDRVQSMSGMEFRNLIHNRSNIRGLGFKNRSK